MLTCDAGSLLDGRLTVPQRPADGLASRTVRQPLARSRLSVKLSSRLWPGTRDERRQKDPEVRHRDRHRFGADRPSLAPNRPGDIAAQAGQNGAPVGGQDVAATATSTAAEEVDTGYSILAGVLVLGIGGGCY